MDAWVGPAHALFLDFIYLSSQVNLFPKGQDRRVYLRRRMKSQSVGGDLFFLILVPGFLPFLSFSHSPLAGKYASGEEKENQEGEENQEL